MTRPTVSVIIPVYQGSATIGEAIRSVLDQTFSDLEIIVVDDGSTDDVKERVRAAGAPIRLIEQSNLGPAAARNRGIENSSGSIIAFLDADDLWCPDKLARQLPLFQRNAHLGMAFGNVRFLGAAGSPRETYFDLYSPRRGHVFSELYAVNFVPWASVLIPGDTLRAVGMFNESVRYGEDYDLLLRLAHKYEVDYVPDVVATYRIGPRQVSRNLVAAATHLLETKERIFRAYPDAFRGADTRVLERGLYAKYLRLALCHMREGNRVAAGQALDRYLKARRPGLTYSALRALLWMPNVVIRFVIHWRDVLYQRPDLGIY